jgi:amidase
MMADAFIVKRIKGKGGIILGKANLSEWANFLCLECPNGYSAVGGQTLNPYGRKKIRHWRLKLWKCFFQLRTMQQQQGTETSGSILSFKYSIVGLKPTTSLLSRSGIVPLSSTLDTPGPMTKNVIDSAILVSVMTEDSADPVTENSPKDNKKYWESYKLQV